MWGKLFSVRFQVLLFDSSLVITLIIIHPKHLMSKFFFVGVRIASAEVLFCFCCLVPLILLLLKCLYKSSSFHVFTFWLCTSIFKYLNCPYIVTQADPVGRCMGLASPFSKKPRLATILFKVSGSATMWCFSVNISVNISGNKIKQELFRIY